MVQPTDPQLRDTLRARGMRATGARVRVLRVLLDSDRPLSHAEVCERTEDGGFDRATVYRNLTDLVDAGLARRSDHGDHVWRFERADAAVHKHPHFVCTECGTVECLPEDAVRVKGIAHVDDVQLRGRCEACVA